MSRPRLLFARLSRTRETRRAVAEDYRIYATYWRTGSGTFMGDLKVVRITDDRLLFPFDGAPAIGPFETAADARAAAELKGAEMIAADMANPE